MKNPQSREFMSGERGLRFGERVNLCVRQIAENRFYRVLAPEPDEPLVPEPPLESEVSDEPLLPVAVDASLAFVEAPGVVLMPGVSPGAEAPEVVPMSVDEPEVPVSVVPHAASTMAHKREMVHFIIGFS